LSDCDARLREKNEKIKLVAQVALALERPLYRLKRRYFLEKEPAPDFDKEPALLALVDYAKALPRLKQFLLLDRGSDLSTTRLRLKGEN
jgi:hypothetical protein